MIRGIFCVILGLLGTGSVNGQEKCVSIADADKRLACYDEANDFVQPGEPTIVPPLPTYRFQVRNDGRFDNFAGSDMGSKNAEVVFERESGDNFILANVSMLVARAPINDSGWQPFASVSWQRTETAKKRSDLRELSVGMAIPLGDPFSGGVGFFVTPRFINRTDIYGDTDSDLFTTHVNVVRQSWTNAEAGNMKKNQFIFVPNFGLIHESRENPGSDSGDWNSGYVGAEFSAQLNRITPRLQATLKYQYFSDFSSPDGTDQRDDHWGMASLSYEFTDPNDTKIKIRPAIILSREVGLNPLRSADRMNETKLGIGIKVDTY